jgi:hypothetical protein
MIAADELGKLTPSSDASDLLTCIQKVPSLNPES